MKKKKIFLSTAGIVISGSLTTAAVLLAKIINNSDIEVQSKKVKNKETALDWKIDDDKEKLLHEDNDNVSNDTDTNSEIISKDESTIIKSSAEIEENKEVQSEIIAETEAEYEQKSVDRQIIDQLDISKIDRQEIPAITETTLNSDEQFEESQSKINNLHKPLNSNQFTSNSQGGSSIIDIDTKIDLSTSKIDKISFRSLANIQDFKKIIVDKMKEQPNFDTLDESHIEVFDVGNDLPWNDVFLSKTQLHVVYSRELIIKVTNTAKTKFKGQKQVHVNWLKQHNSFEEENECRNKELHDKHESFSKTIIFSRNGGKFVEISN